MKFLFYFILSRFYFKSELSLKRRIAEQSQHKSILEILCFDKDYSVRVAVGSNKHSSLFVFKKLYRDQSDEVRYSVARNPVCPHVILEKLSRDNHSNIREAVALNENSNETILRRLSKDHQWWIREKVAYHSNCPDDLLLDLINDSHEAVVEAVLKSIFLNKLYLLNFLVKRNHSVVLKFLKDNRRMIMRSLDTH